MKIFYNLIVTLEMWSSPQLCGKILAKSRHRLGYTSSKRMEMRSCETLTSPYAQDWKDRFRLPAVV